MRCTARVVACWPGIITLILTICLRENAHATPSLHQRIDALVAAQAGGDLAPVASDDEFLRRAYLDLNGTIPSAAEARAFLNDTSADKRVKLIDRLLAAPDYARHMAEVFDVMLMERRTREDAPSVAWRHYLQASFAANKAWDQLAREILCPEADDEGQRGAAAFYVKRLEKVGANPVDYPGLTRDVGRLFLGVDLKCAQCHNHKYIKDYKQVDFQGLFAFVGQTFIRTDLKFAAVGEKPLLKKIEYVSVFNPEKKAIGPRLPFSTELAIPAFEKGKEWDRLPDPKAKFLGTPKFRTLRLLADQVARADNDLFKRNSVNRLWFVLMGRGLVQPLDMAHADNPPSHPELLALLADELVATKFDVKAFLRELALSQTYQRSSLLPSGADCVPAESYRVSNAKGLSSEQMARCLLMATGELEAAAARTDAKAVVAAVPAADADTVEPETKLPPAKGAASLREVCKRCTAAFAGPAGEPEVEFAPTVAGALFVSNDPLMLAWLNPRPGNLVGRLLALPDGDVAEELYLSVLSRLPTDEERAEAANYLAKSSRRREAAMKELAWSLLASTEFAVNH